MYGRPTGAGTSLVSYRAWRGHRSGVRDAGGCRAVIDLGSKTWATVRAQLLPAGYPPAICPRRLATAGRVRRLQKSLYVVADPVRDTPPIAIADAIFAELDHYVTTDAALMVQGLIDQPVPVITVVLTVPGRRSVRQNGASVHPVTLAGRTFSASQTFETTTEGFRLRLATREQAVVDALAEPRWMTHFSLLPEILRSFDESEIARTAERAIERSGAAAQSLAFLLEDAGREIPTPLAAVKPKSTVDLVPRHRHGVFSTRWRVYG